MFYHLIIIILIIKKLNKTKSQMFYKNKKIHSLSDGGEYTLYETSYKI